MSRSSLDQTGDTQDHSYELLEKEYLVRRAELVSFDYDFLINFGKVALKTGHIRRSVEITREALSYARNKNETVLAYISLSRTYRTMVLVQNSEAELKRACVVAGIEYPRLNIIKLILLIPTFFIPLSTNKWSNITNKSTAVEDKKVLVELYEEIGLCAYYLRYPHFLLLQISLQVRQIVKDLGPSMAMVNYLGATATVFGIQGASKHAYSYIESAMEISLKLDSKYAIAKTKIWESLLVSYLNNAKQSSELFESVLKKYKPDLNPYEIRLVCSTLSMNYNLRGKATLSLQAVEQMITEYDKKCDEIFSCNKTFIEWHKIPALCFLGKNTEAERIIINSQAVFSSVDNEMWQIILYLGDYLIYQYLSPKRDLLVVGDILKRFGALKLTPRQTFLESHHFWVAKAYLSLDMFYDGQVNVNNFYNDLADVKIVSKFQEASIHYLVLEGHKYFMQKKYKKVRKTLTNIMHLAHEYDNDWVLYEAYKLQTLLEFKEHGQEAGIVSRDDLLRWLEEKQLIGYVHNLTKTIDNHS